MARHYNQQTGGGMFNMNGRLRVKSLVNKEAEDNI